MIYKNTFIADIKYGSCDEDLKKSQVPTEFIESKKLWKKKKYDEACKIITPFLKCTLEVSDVFHRASKKIFDIDVTKDIEAEKDSIKISSVGYTDWTMPSIRATAKFVIPSKKELTQEEIYAWEEKNEEQLLFGVRFKWNIPNVPYGFTGAMYDYSDLWFHFIDSGNDKFTTAELRPKMEFLAKIHNAPLSRVIAYLKYVLDEQIAEKAKSADSA